MAVPVDMKFHRYVIDSLDILIPGDKEPNKILPDVIQSLVIENDYDNRYFPVISISLAMDTDMYYRILENKTTVKFRLRLQKYTYSDDNLPKVKSDVFNETFAIFLDENTPHLQQKTYEAMKTETGEDKAPLDIGGNIRTFFLFKDRDISYADNIVNNVLANVTMMDVMTYCLSTTGFSGVLMAPFDNKEVYSEVLLLPYPLLGNFEYLENQFGFYSRGALIFFDVPRIYIIDKNSKCTAWEEGEFKKTVFHIKNSNNSDNFSPGSVGDEKEKTHYVNVVPSDITMSNDSIIKDKLYGTHLLIVDPNSGDVANIKTSTIQRGDGTYRVMVNHYGNKFINNMQKTAREESGSTVQLVLEDIDIDALTPNKEFVFTYENQAHNSEYGGNHRINKCIYAFTKKGQEFAVMVSANFKKI